MTLFANVAVAAADPAKVTIPLATEAVRLATPVAVDATSAPIVPVPLRSSLSPVEIALVNPVI